MGIICIFAGILFLLNPTIRLIDFMPDIIGALLIIIGASRLCMVESRIALARKAMYYMVALSVFKIPMSLYIPLKAKDYLLPATFVFSCLETLILISFFTSLIAGLEYFVSRDSDDPLHSRKAQSASVVAFIFSIAKGVLTFIPELLIISQQTDSFDYTYSPTAAQTVSMLKPYLEILCFVVILIFAIYTAVLLGKYLLGLAKDKVFTGKLSQRVLQHRIDHAEDYNLRRITHITTLIFVSNLLLFSPVLESVNILPNTLSLTALACGVLLIPDKRIRYFIPAFLPAVAFSVYNDILSYRLLSETDIAIKGTEMRIRHIPDMLQNTSALTSLIIPLAAEAIAILLLNMLCIRKTEKLDFLAPEKESYLTGLFYKLSLPLFLASNALASFFKHARTAYAAETESVSVYAKYDGMQEISQWISYVSFIVLIYCAYKHLWGLRDRVKTK